MKAHCLKHTREATVLLNYCYYHYSTLLLSNCINTFLQWRTQDFVTEGEGRAVRPEKPKAGLGFWGGAASPSLRERSTNFPSRVRYRAPAAQRISHILSALDGISYCILRALCTEKLCSARGKGSVRFVEAMWNSSCDNQRQLFHAPCMILLRLWRYISHLLTYLLTYMQCIAPSSERTKRE